MAKGTHEYTDDPRNKDILININGELFKREDAKVSVFDSGYILGDGVWEGLRVHSGVIVLLKEHLQRLYTGAKAIDMDIGISRQQLADRLYETLEQNDMLSDLGGDQGSGVHIRLMVTRGIKATPYQDPRITISPATIVIIPEYKDPLPDTVSKGISLYTVAVRRGDPAVQDQKLNSHSKLNCITACIQAAKAGADEALMLDPHGFVATCNSTHFFIVKDGEVWTSSGDYCLGGITRSTVLKLCAQQGIIAREKNFSLTDVYGADEAFVTGTFAGLVPVHTIDGRTIGWDDQPTMPGPVVTRLQGYYKAYIQELVKRGRDL